MWCVYLIENKEGKIYIGHTANVDERVKRHNQPKGCLWTQGRGPWKVIYTEEFETKAEAIKREKKIKSLKAGQRIKKIFNII